MQSGHISNFKHLSQFSSLKDFNNNIEQWMTDIKSSFTKSELIALKRLIRFAAKIPGICNAKIQTIIAATHKKNEMGGISRSTFERMLRKAKSFGMLTVENTMKYGKQGHNVYVFMPYTAQEVLLSEKLEVVEKQNIEGAGNSLSFESNNTFIKNTYPKPEPLNFYGQFKNLLYSTIGDNQKLISKLYSVYLGQTSLLVKHEVYEKETLESVAYDALVTAVMSTKTCRIKNLPGWFNGILDRKLTALAYQEAERGLEEEALAEAN